MKKYQIRIVLTEGRRIESDYTSTSRAGALIDALNGLSKEDGLDLISINVVREGQWD